MGCQRKGKFFWRCEAYLSASVCDLYIKKGTVNLNAGGQGITLNNPITLGDTDGGNAAATLLGNGRWPRFTTTINPGKSTGPLTIDSIYFGTSTINLNNNNLNFATTDANGIGFFSNLALVISGTGNITFAAGAGPIPYTPAINHFATVNTLPDGYHVVYEPNQILIQAVPEPTTWVGKNNRLRPIAGVLLYFAD